MSCAACSARVEKAVCAVPGVTGCAVSLLTNSMGVEGTASTQAVIDAVVSAGYGASVHGEASASVQEDPLRDRQTPLLRRRLIASLLFLFLLMFLSMGHSLLHLPLPAFLEGNPLGIAIVQMLLAGIVMVINQRFFISGFQGHVRRSPNMDTLVAMGSMASFTWSVVVLLLMTLDPAGAASRMHDLYFESAAMILALITVGKMLEARSKGKTTDALRALMKLSPQTAVLVREGREVEFPIDQVVIGDIFVVRPGTHIPVDGVVLEGTSAVNESALTGESHPVDKAAGDSVSAATANTSGFLRCRATRVGSDTTLSQIVRMVSDAAATKAPIAKIADRVSGVFVPAVIGIAALTLFIWLLAGERFAFALARSISVLVISCPCALGLATPVAIMVGNGVGARQGILFKTAVSLENAGRTQIVVLDKTGTITRGEPVVTDILPSEGVSRDELLRCAVTLERRSEHPLALAVLQLSREEGLEGEDVQDFEILPGNGLQAQGQGVPLVGGSVAFLSRHTPLPQALRAQAGALSASGKTPLCFARGGRILGLIAVADVVKEDSAQAVRELQNMGIRVVMLTGDNARTAQAIGRQVGVDEVISDVLPEGKEAVIRRLSAAGKVAMVGDGINDAPALTRADTGIAIGAGTDVAIDAADIVLMKSRLSDVAAAIRLSRAILHNIRQNLFWAFFYNIIGIPLAAGAYYPAFGLLLSPMFGAAAMSLSSFCVVTNALRLNWFNPHDASRDRPGRGAVALPETYISNETIKEEPSMNKTLHIEGMMCPHCEASVKKALESLEGVSEAVVSHTSGTAQVTLTADVADDVLKSAVEARDYRVTGIDA